MEEEEIQIFFFGGCEEGRVRVLRFCIVVIGAVSHPLSRICIVVLCLGTTLAVYIRRRSIVLGVIARVGLV